MPCFRFHFPSAAVKKFRVVYIEKCAEPHSSVGSVADVRIGGHRFDPSSTNILSKD